ncbi:hypothetical protein LSAT2_028208 [Lamellibrachia satsuma]|nr:hypothetical protein LSAT2_028208 [Lamellibrachia satsuma]
MSTTPGLGAAPGTTTTRNGMHFAPEHLRSQIGIFQLTEIIVSFVTFICSVVWPYYPGNGWVFFVSGSSFLTITIRLLYYLFGLRQMKIEIAVFCEFVTYCIITGCFVIAGIVAAVSGHYNGSVAATAFFAFAASAIYGLDTIIKFQIWRGGEPLSIIAEPTTPNEDTTEAKAEY